MSVTLFFFISGHLILLSKTHRTADTPVFYTSVYASVYQSFLNLAAAQDLCMCIAVNISRMGTI